MIRKGPQRDGGLQAHGFARRRQALRATVPKKKETPLTFSSSRLRRSSSVLSTLMRPAAPESLTPPAESLGSSVDSSIEITHRRPEISV